MRDTPQGKADLLSLISKSFRSLQAHYRGTGGARRNLGRILPCEPESLKTEEERIPRRVPRYPSSTGMLLCSHLPLSFSLLRPPRKWSSPPKSDTPVLGQTPSYITCSQGNTSSQEGLGDKTLSLGLAYFIFFFFLYHPHLLQPFLLISFPSPPRRCVFSKNTRDSVLPVLWVAVFILAVRPTREEFGAEPLGSVSTWIHTRDPASRKGKGVTRPSENQDSCSTPDGAYCSIPGTYWVPGDITSHTELGGYTDPHAGARETLVSPLTLFTSTLVIMQPLLTLLSIPFILASVPVRPSRQG